MKNTSAFAVGIVIVILILAGTVYFLFASKAVAPVLPKTTTATSTSAASVTTVTYFCTIGGIVASYSADSVALTLSDGRSMTLPQVRSGSGIRYESTSTSAVPGTDVAFSSKGSDAFLMEGSKTTYDNCVGGTTTSANGQGTKTFTDQDKTFSFEYSPVFSISGGGIGYTQSWMQNSTDQGLLLVKATLPRSFEPKTNFSDATFTVGTSPSPDAVTKCLTAPASGNGVQKSQVMLNGVQYTKFITSDAGAGNFYQTTSYRTMRDGQCYVVEYTIHSTNIGNYSPDQGIKAFNQAKVQALLEGMVQSFKFL